MAVVALSTAIFGGLNIANATAGAPQWSQDLAFFHQWVHSAASGGPWASPLILEPQGFFDQVHTHLILPLVVGAYKIVPAQATLLVIHSFFVSLALWPAMQLGNAVAGGRYAILVVLAILFFGPFQAVAVADFRPVGLFIPGILGIWAASWRGSTRAMLLWAILAILGRQEASYLVAASGLSLLLFRWGRSSRTDGIALLVVGAASWALFLAVKPEMFFHINPLASPSIPESAELWERRGLFAAALMLSGWSLGLLRPAPLFAALPVFGGMLMTGREWHALTGPGAHHHSFWLPFILAAGIAGCARLSTNLGPVLLLAGSALSFPWASRSQGNALVQGLAEQVPPGARVAADYDTIHRLSGRSVLWNIDQLYMPDRPWHWQANWPLTVLDVDWVIAPDSHPVTIRLSDWTVVGTAERHRLYRRSD